jgi:hypothetical protein
MAIYRPKCRGEKPDDADYLHREMTNSVFRYAAGGLAGALAALLANLTYAETLNQNLRIALEAPQSLVVGDGGRTTATERSRPVRIAQAKKPLPGVKSAEPPATAAEIVGKMLAPGASNPDVPLPHPDLAEKFADRTEVEGPLRGPTPYGRGETGGGVLGFRVPIPVERGPAAGATISSSEPAGLGTPLEGVSKPR